MGPSPPAAGHIASQGGGDVVAHEGDRCRSQESYSVAVSVGVAELLTDVTTGLGVGRVPSSVEVG